MTRLPDDPTRSAVLLSGGLDSAVLAADEATRGAVQPIYVGVGLAWEGAERESIARFLEAIAPRFRIDPLVVLSFDMRDVYPPTHWAVAGPAPGYHTPDEDVYLPGRNLALLSQAGIFCASSGIGRLVLGTLDRNPFPDATPEFRAAMAQTLSKGLGRALRIDAPYAREEKADVIRRGVALDLPLALTLSCMQPLNGGHCGACSKCRERHTAFVRAGVADPTQYDDVRCIDG